MISSVSSLIKLTTFFFTQLSDDQIGGWKRLEPERVLSKEDSQRPGAHLTVFWPSFSDTVSISHYNNKILYTVYVQCKVRFVLD